MHGKLWPKPPAKKGTSSFLYTYKFFEKPNKKITIGPKSYTAMLIYLFFDYLLSTCPKKMKTEKWSKVVDSTLHS